VAQSNFARYPAFGKAGKGHLCLQDHGGPVAFRNIKLRKWVSATRVSRSSHLAKTEPERFISCRKRFEIKAFIGWSKPRVVNNEC